MGIILAALAILTDTARLNVIFYIILPNILYYGWMDIYYIIMYMLIIGEDWIICYICLYVIYICLDHPHTKNKNNSHILIPYHNIYYPNTYCHNIYYTQINNKYKYPSTHYPNTILSLWRIIMLWRVYVVWGRGGNYG